MEPCHEELTPVGTTDPLGRQRNKLKLTATPEKRTQGDGVGVGPASARLVQKRCEGIRPPEESRRKREPAT